MTKRSFVPFESLWKMPIELPYSLLVRDGDYAWSCGQLALDSDSNVLAANDLEAQSTIVAGYITEVLRRGSLDAKHLKRLLLYYVPTAGDAARVEAMRDAFRAVLGEAVILDPIPVPHFYYDGVVLEVDAFAGPTTNDRFEWLSIEAAPEEIQETLDNITTVNTLSAHWYVPAADIAALAPELERRGLVHDAGAVVSAGPNADVVRATIIRTSDNEVETTIAVHADVRVTSNRADGVGWIAARCTNQDLGLVEQTEQIMSAVAITLDGEGVDFGSVVKSTTLYVGGSSAEELHANMAVRNRHYSPPGPASTGLPIFGLADTASRLTIDITYID